ncbi:methyltransferase domain-containing protein [Lachnospiraceae bacterium 62-35]
MDSIDYYNKYAAAVFEDTAEQDMNDIMKEFLECMEEGAAILDLGCGSGRDSLSFYEMGYDVTPLDGSEEMCKLAEIHTDLDVLHMDFRQMDFDDAFDGIWACASLIHIPKKELPEMLDRISEALKRDGIVYMSFHKGDFEGFSGERYFSDYTEKEIERMIKESNGLKLIKLWETEDKGYSSSHENGTWLNVLSRKA